MQKGIFKKWVPEKYAVPILGVLLFPHLMILTVFHMNSTFTASFLDLEVEDLQFLFSMAYATIVCGLFLHVRLFHYFNIRTYLLVMTMLNILVLFSMTLTKNTQLIYLLRLIQGPLSLLEGCILLPILMSKVKGENPRLVAYTILYGIMMCGDKFSTSVVKWAIESYSHNFMLCARIKQRPTTKQRQQKKTI